ncbi:Arabinogalactan endo-beta-1,4-galactanase OS=Streptomyces antimycoticus OX=68175 GN=SSPO_003800 PE=3 SV=1 [Streptomyces antimycoticus]
MQRRHQGDHPHRDADSDAHARWFYDGIKAKGVNWDITGLSYYCMWHGTLSTLYDVVADMRSRYGKDVVIAETAYPFTTANADSTGNSVTSGCSGYPLTWTGQAANFTDVQNTARNAGMLGPSVVRRWKRQWDRVPGNGQALPAISGHGAAAQA